MSWLATAGWAAAAIGAALLLAALYIYDVHGNGTLAGLLAFVALLLLWQSIRIKGWLQRLQRARDADSE